MLSAVSLVTRTGTKIKSKHWTELAEGLKINRYITKLELRDNSMGAEGVRKLTAALNNNYTITSLELRDNSIWDEGAKDLAKSLRFNGHLTHLNLHANSIGADGAREVRTQHTNGHAPAPYAG